MPPSGPDASNNCLPPACPVTKSWPPIPSPKRGERVSLEAKAGRVNGNKPLLAYGSGKLVVIRNLLSDEPLLPPDTCQPALPVLVYRGHTQAPVTAVKLAPSGAYMASGDERGQLRVWAVDHPEHLAKYAAPSLAGPIHDIDWADTESKRIVLGGHRSDPSSECARVVQWDTGVSTGQLAQHLKGRVSAVAMKPARPFRIVTAGADDTRTYFHQGPPFTKIPPSNGSPADACHATGSGAVTCIRYNHAGTLVVSTGADRAIVVYDGKTLEQKYKLEKAHTATIYSVAWSADDAHILTASGDGTCQQFALDSGTGALTPNRVWKPAEHQFGATFEKVPVGGTQLGCAYVQGTRPVSVGLNGQISLLPVTDGDDSIEILTGHNAPVAGLALDRKNGVFYTGDSNGILCQWSLETCQPIKRLEPPEGNADLMYVVHNGAISALGCVGDALLSTGWDDKLYVTDSKSATVGLNPVSLAAQPSAMAVGSNLAVICTVQGLLLVSKGEILPQDGAGGLFATSYTPTAAAVTKNDVTIYVGGDDCNIYVYQLLDGAHLKQTAVIANGHLKPLSALAISNDETKLAAGDARDVCVWDLTNADGSGSGEYKALIARGRWCFHVQKITCLSWSPDDKVVASGGADDSIYLWSMEKKMKRIHYPYAHRGGLTALAFIKDGYKFVTAGTDAVVNLWNPAKDILETFGHKGRVWLD